jgi:two-component system OmpR family response regulator
MSTVLIIEDDPDIRELERLMLSHSGHAVVIAANGREALDVLERLRPNLILLDLMMPVMDGLTFLVERRRRGLATDVPVICISAAGEQTLKRAQQLGAWECIPKPADVDELCDRVDQYCRLL